MAVKTITIDTEAYEILSRYKAGRKSFSQVIKEQLGARRTGRDLRHLVERLRLSEDTLATVDVLIRRRRRSRASAPKL